MKALNENIFHQYNKWKKNYVRKENSIIFKLNDFLDRNPSYEDILSISEDGKYVNCSSSIVIYDGMLINGKFPFPFGIVSGHFNCSECEELISLEGAPKEIGGNFKFYLCPNLTSLVGAPKEVGKSFSCNNCPKLTSLEGAPEKVGGDFSCQKTLIKSLEGAPINVGGNFICDEVDYLESLEGAPNHVGGDFSCSKCPSLTSLDGLPTTIDGDLFCGKKFRGKEIPKNTIVKGNIIYYV